MFLFLIILFLFSVNVYTQEINFVYETVVIPGSRDVPDKLYYSFRVPYNRLVFERQEADFSAGYEVLVELKDSSGTALGRRIATKNIIVTSFDETNSSENYSEGVLEFNVQPGKLTVIALITDLKSDKELRLPPKELLIKPLIEERFLNPVVVYKKKIQCNDKTSYRLANFEGNIPFGEEAFDIFIPAADTALESITVEILKDDSLFWKGIVVNKIIGRISIAECSGVMVDIDNENSSASYFIISEVSEHLNEGIYSLRVTGNNEQENKKLFGITVKWYNRPLSLSDPEHALISLRYIISEDEVENLLSNKSPVYRDVLNTYWSKLDPTPSTMFNPLMLEYYERIDYAVKHFASIGRKDGSGSDRGKIFIKYGRPSGIERSSTDSGNIVETWLYDKNKFIFVDEKGTGEFLLIQG